METNEIDEFMDGPDESAKDGEVAVAKGNLIDADADTKVGDAEADNAKVEDSADSKPAADSGGEQDESFLIPDNGTHEDDDEAGLSDSENKVPVHVIAKQRGTIRELKAEIARLRQSRPDGVESETADADVDAVINESLKNVPDDDYIDKKTFVDTVKKAVAAATVKAVKQTRESVNADTVRQSEAEFIALCKRSEAYAKKNIDDYIDVMRTGKELNLVNDDDRKKALDSTHPAKALYTIVKSKLLRLQNIASGNSSENKGKPPKKDVTQDDILNDEEFFDKSVNG